MDIINKLVFNHVIAALVSSHAFVALLANADRLIALALKYFSASQIDAGVDAAAGAIKDRVNADANKKP